MRSFVKTWGSKDKKDRSVGGVIEELGITWPSSMDQQLLLQQQQQQQQQGGSGKQNGSSSGGMRPLEVNGRTVAEGGGAAGGSAAGGSSAGGRVLGGEGERSSLMSQQAPAPSDTGYTTEYSEDIREPRPHSPLAQAPPPPSLQTPTAELELDQYVHEEMDNVDSDKFKTPQDQLPNGLGGPSVKKEVLEPPMGENRRSGRVEGAVGATRTPYQRPAAAAIRAPYHGEDRSNPQAVMNFPYQQQVMRLQVMERRRLQEEQEEQAEEAEERRHPQQQYSSLATLQRKSQELREEQRAMQAGAEREKEQQRVRVEAQKLSSRGSYNTGMSGEQRAAAAAAAAEAGAESEDASELDAPYRMPFPSDLEGLMSASQGQGGGGGEEDEGDDAKEESADDGFSRKQIRSMINRIKVQFNDDGTDGSVGGGIGGFFDGSRSPSILEGLSDGEELDQQELEEQQRQQQQQQQQQQQPPPPPQQQQEEEQEREQNVQTGGEATRDGRAAFPSASEQDTAAGGGGGAEEAAQLNGRASEEGGRSPQDEGRPTGEADKLTARNLTSKASRESMSTSPPTAPNEAEAAVGFTSSTLDATGIDVDEDLLRFAREALKCARQEAGHPLQKPENQSRNSYRLELKTHLRSVERTLRNGARSRLAERKMHLKNEAKMAVTDMSKEKDIQLEEGRVFKKAVKKKIDELCDIYDDVGERLKGIETAFEEGSKQVQDDYSAKVQESKLQEEARVRAIIKALSKENGWNIDKASR